MGDEKSIVWIEGRSFSSENSPKNDWGSLICGPLYANMWDVGREVGQQRSLVDTFPIFWRWKMYRKSVLYPARQEHSKFR